MAWGSNYTPSASEVTFAGLSAQLRDWFWMQSNRMKPENKMQVPVHAKSNVARASGGKWISKDLFLRFKDEAARRKEKSIPVLSDLYAGEFAYDVQHPYYLPDVERGIFLRMHNTDIIRWSSHGASVQLNTGGWIGSPSTRSWLNILLGTLGDGDLRLIWCQPTGRSAVQWAIVRRRGDSHVWWSKRELARNYALITCWYDGVTFGSNGKLLTERQPLVKITLTENNVVGRLRALRKAYAGFVALDTGNPIPDAEAYDWHGAFAARDIVRMADECVAGTHEPMLEVYLYLRGGLKSYASRRAFGRKRKEFYTPAEAFDRGLHRVWEYAVSKHIKEEEIYKL